jgi:hypothetical protein
VFAMFFFLSLYMQQVLHYSALRAGLAYLAIAGSTIPLAGIAQALTTRFGPRPILAIGMLANAATLAWFTQVRVHGHYPVDLLPGFLVGAVGLAFAFVPMSIAALAGVAARDAGLASGLINTSQQIGGAVGIAVLSTIATNHTHALQQGGTAFLPAFVSGFHYAFAAGAGISFAAVLLTLVMIKRVEPVHEPVTPVVEAG